MTGVKQMSIENLSIICSMLALSISIINILSTLCDIKSRITCKRISIKIKSEKKMNAYFQTYKNGIEDIHDYLKSLSHMTNLIYPKCFVRISIKLISKSDNDSPSKSEIVTWVSYPEDTDESKVSYKYIIRDNTDFSSIVINKNKYFFVSDLLKYSALNSYVNQNYNWFSEYNTSIVFPIQYSDSNSENIIGFLCLTSPQKLSNVKKNRHLIYLMKKSATMLYKYLDENEFKKQIISIRD